MKNNANIFNYFLCRCLFLGGGLSNIIIRAQNDSYISVLLGMLLGAFFIYIITKLNNKINSSLPRYLHKKSFINYLFKVIYFLYLLFLIFLLLISISTFIYSYFLPYTPSLVSCIPLIFLACFLNSKSSKNISYISGVLMIISVTLIILKTSLLTGEFEINNILPILTTKPIDIFKGALIYCILSVAPFLTTLGEQIDFKQTIKYYFIASIANFIVLVSVTLTMGELLNVYSHPEYAVLRKIRFFDFIENIENILTVTWFYDIFIAMSIASLKIKEVLNTKKQLIPFILVSIMMVSVHLFITDRFNNSMLIYKSFVYVFSIFLFIILLLIILKNKKQKQH